MCLHTTATARTHACTWYCSWCMALLLLLCAVPHGGLPRRVPVRPRHYDIHPIANPLAHSTALGQL